MNLMKKRSFIFVVAGIFISSSYLLLNSCLGDQKVIIGNEPMLDEEWEDALEIELNPLIELDFKTRDEIYDIRRNYVNEYPQLVEGDYEPSTKVFGYITDKKPWLGILGISYYGVGKKSIEGPSEESRFIANPFLLIGLDEGYAYDVSDMGLEPQPIYPTPIRLIWSKDKRSAKVWYDIGDFWDKKREYFYPPSQNLFILISYNARDLGFNYLYLVPQNSKNITFLDERVAPIPLRHFLHSGGSCGYPGGCNNMSPWMGKFRIKIHALPARVYLKLWRKKPKDISKPADMVFIIEMI